MSKTAKLKLYFLVIRPAVTHACETWILDGTIIKRLTVFERKILRKILGPTYENGSWRIKTNHELDKRIQQKNIIHFVRTQRLELYGHIERMQKQEWSKQYTPGNPFRRGQREDQRYAGRIC